MFERSAWLIRAVSIIHALALIAALANPLPPGIRIVLAVAVIGSLKFTLNTLAQVQALTLKADGDWEILQASGPISGIWLDNALVTPWLVILPLNTDAGQRSLLICRDGSDPESFRRLRVYLRITAPTRTHTDSR